MSKIVLISPSLLGSKAIGAMTKALQSEGFAVMQNLQRAACEDWEFIEEDNFLLVTILNCVVSKYISESEFRLVLYERSNVTLKR